MQSKYFAHQTPQSKTIFVVLEILTAFLVEISHCKEKQEQETQNCHLH